MPQLERAAHRAEARVAPRGQVGHDAHEAWVARPDLVPEGHAPRIRLVPPRYHLIDTLFAVPEAWLFARLVEHFEHELGQALGAEDYERIYNDIRATIDRVHADDSLKDVIRADLPTYIDRDPDLPEGRALALGVLDCGLTAEQQAWCRAQGATLVVPKWDFDFPGREKLKDGYKALTARPFLPRYFPGHDLYLWIDGDCWVQQGDAIDLFLRAAGTGALAVAPEIHRSMRHYKHAWAEFSSVNGAAYESCFDKATAERLIRFPLINAGVFALAADAPQIGRAHV